MFLLFNLKEIFTALNTIENKTRDFILDRLNTLNSVVDKLDDGYELELTLEKDGLQVEIANQVLQNDNLPSSLLDVRFNFSLVDLEADFVIVLDRNNDETTDVFPMNYDNTHEQFYYIIQQLLECNQESKMQLLKDLHNNETHGIIHENQWRKSAKHHLKSCVDTYDMEELKREANRITDGELCKDNYRVHNSLLTLNKDGIYKYFQLLVDNLNHYHSGAKQEVKDLNGNSQPDYIKEK